jgi:hypothetical protein
MSEVRKGSSKSSSKTQLGFVTMSICLIGGRHCSVLALEKSELQISGGRNRLLYQMGRSGALVTITIGAIKAFLWKAIVCRFWIPYALVTDNGTQFDCRPFQEWCSEVKIRHFFSSVYHPQSNGQNEATNKTLVRILKKKLLKRKKRMGRVSTGSLVVLSNHNPLNNFRNPLLPNIRNRRGDSG